MYPRRGVCWFWAGVVRPGAPGPPYVLCRELELAPPGDPSVLDVRGLGLWSHAICETPVEHWTVAMEAFAVTLDDPFEAWGTERGDRIGLAFDLEWEGAGPLVPVAAVSGAADAYGLDCEVHGELLLGDEQWMIAARGRRTHEWGTLTWPASPTPAPSASAVLAEAPLLVDRPSGTTGRLLHRLVATTGGPVWAEPTCE